MQKEKLLIQQEKTTYSARKITYLTREHEIAGLTKGNLAEIIAAVAK